MNEYDAANEHGGVGEDRRDVVTAGPLNELNIQGVIYMFYPQF